MHGDHGYEIAFMCRFPTPVVLFKYEIWQLSPHSAVRARKPDRENIYVAHPALEANFAHVKKLNSIRHFCLFFEIGKILLLLPLPLFS